MASNTLLTAPAATYSRLPVTEPADLERGVGKVPREERLPLSSSWENVRLEWKHGSRTRVVKYFTIAVILGLVIGAGIGLVLALVK